MSSKNLPKEKFFLLPVNGSYNKVTDMDTPQQIYNKFFIALKKHETKYGRGFNKFLSGETGISTGFLSLVLAGKKQPSQEAQMKISAACGLDYKSFIGDTTTKQGDTDLLEKIRLQQEIIELQRDKIRLLEQRLGEDQQATGNQVPLPKEA